MIKDHVFKRENFIGKETKKETFYECEFQNCNFMGSTFINCRFVNSVFNFSCFGSVQFIGCEFINSYFLTNEIHQTTFNSCTLHHVTFEEGNKVIADEVLFSECFIYKTNLCELKIQSTKLSEKISDYFKSCVLCPDSSPKSFASSNEHLVLKAYRNEKKKTSETSRKTNQSAKKESSFPILNKEIIPSKEKMSELNSSNKNLKENEISPKKDEGSGRFGFLEI